MGITWNISFPKCCYRLSVSFAAYKFPVLYLAEPLLNCELSIADIKLLGKLKLAGGAGVMTIECTYLHHLWTSNLAILCLIAIN